MDGLPTGPHATLVVTRMCHNRLYATHVWAAHTCRRMVTEEPDEVRVSSKCTSPSPTPSAAQRTGIFFILDVSALSMRYIAFIVFYDASCTTKGAHTEVRTSVSFCRSLSVHTRV